MKCGIVGLPNVGKSTFFNFLTKSNKAVAGNFPFCTIDPNIAKVEVIDQRLDELSKISGSEKKIYSFIEVVDIAGLVKGSSKGEGLGNKFLQNIAEVDIIVHIVRCFKDENIEHVMGTINPLEDMDIINTELQLSDLEKINKAKEKKIDRLRLQQLEDLENAVKNQTVIEDEYIKPLSFKKQIILCNGDNEDLINSTKNFCNERGIACFAMDINFLQEADSLEEGNSEYREELNKMIKEIFTTLGLICFFTSGRQETRSWSIPKGYNALEASGKIHTDFLKHFIRAEIHSFEEFIDKKRSRIESKNYIVQDGDVILFHTSAKKR